MPADLPGYDAPAFTLMPAASTPAASGQTSGFGDSGLLTRCERLLCGSCSSGQRFALGFLPTNASRPRSCPSARPSLCRAVNRLTPFLSVRCFTVEQVRPAGRTAKKPAPWERRRLKCVRQDRIRSGKQGAAYRCDSCRGERRPARRSRTARRLHPARAAARSARTGGSCSRRPR